jgi:CRISPR-associated protein Cas2
MFYETLAKFARYIVIYDICEEGAENKKACYPRRGKIARLLLEHGIRTQKSVYEIMAGQKEIKKLIGLFKKITKKKDKIYIYPLSENVYRRTLRLGKPSPMTEHFFI